MSPLELALAYMACFYGEVPLEKMRDLLADDLEFRGPLFEFDSAKAYFDSLMSDPPINVRYEVQEAYEKGNSVCLIYSFMKPNVETTMAQQFEFYEGRIKRIQLIFDSKVFG